MLITNIITSATITAYCSCTNICCPPSSKGLTANGNRPQEGITCAASRAIPFQSTIQINGKSYTVQDRLAKRFDKRFDIYFSTHQKALNFGIKTNQQVTIIYEQK